METNVLTPSKTRNTMRRISAEDAMREPGRERQGQASTTPGGSLRILQEIHPRAGLKTWAVVTSCERWGEEQGVKWTDGRAGSRWNTKKHITFFGKSSSCVTVGEGCLGILEFTSEQQWTKKEFKAHEQIFILKLNPVIVKQGAVIN